MALEQVKDVTIGTGRQIRYFDQISQDVIGVDIGHRHEHQKHDADLMHLTAPVFDRIGVPELVQGP